MEAGVNVTPGFRLDIAPPVLKTVPLFVVPVQEVALEDGKEFQVMITGSPE